MSFTLNFITLWGLLVNYFICFLFQLSALWFFFSLPLSSFIRHASLLEHFSLTVLFQLWLPASTSLRPWFSIFHLLVSAKRKAVLDWSLLRVDVLSISSFPWQLIQYQCLHLVSGSQTFSSLECKSPTP